MDGLRRLGFVGMLVAVGVTGLADRAGAALAIVLGEVYCHAESAGPHYFYSRVDEVRKLAGPSDDQWWPASDGSTAWRPFDDATPLVNRTLEEMAAEFARYVAERHEVDYLLSRVASSRGWGRGGGQWKAPPTRAVVIWSGTARVTRRRWIGRRTLGICCGGTS